MRDDGEQLPSAHQHTWALFSLDIRRAWNQQSTGSLPVQVEGPLLNLAKVTSLSLATLSSKMIKAFESVVVNDKRQVVNTRTGRVINPLVGDDEPPYHIRGSHKFTNKDGHIITVQATSV